MAGATLPMREREKESSNNYRDHAYHVYSLYNCSSFL